MERHQEIISKYEIHCDERAAFRGRGLRVQIIESEATCPADVPICKGFLLLSGDVPDLLFEGPKEMRKPEFTKEEIVYGEFVIGFDCEPDQVVVNGQTHEVGTAPSRHGMEFGPDGYVGIL